MVHERLKEFKNLLCGRRVFIVGGGSSLLGFDYSLLEGNLVIAINQAAEFIPNATAILWTDSGWASTNCDLLAAHSAKFRFQVRDSRIASVMIDKSIMGEANSVIIGSSNKMGMDTDLRFVRGNNSGCYALNLALNCQPKEIVLLGFDMCARRVDGKRVTHSHNRYTMLVQDGIYQDEFLPSIESMLEACKNMGVKIYNCSPVSKIKGAVKSDIGDFLI